MNGRTQQCPTGRKPALPKLYIFPHAGGSVDFYLPFSRAFSTDLKRIAVQYPGRRDRHNLPLITSIPALADDIWRMLTPLDETDGQVIFFGHSMGGLLAFEVAHRFESAGNPIRALFVSACAAPGRMGYEYLQVSDRELLNMLTELTGTNPKFVNDAEFVATILPTLRSVRAIAGYTCPPGTTVSCPIYAFVGDKDEVVTYDNVAAWTTYTTSEFSVRVFPGDHFYLNKNWSHLAKDIEAKISDCCKDSDRL